MAVTVITTTGVTYTVPNGSGMSEEVAPTGELAVTVYDASSNVLALFGSVETVYLNSEVTMAPAAATRSGL